MTKLNRGRHEAPEQNTGNRDYQGRHAIPRVLRVPSAPAQAVTWPMPVSMREAKALLDRTRTDQISAARNSQELPPVPRRKIRQREREHDVSEYGKRTDQI
jgi:hypothetical protein